MFKRKSSYSYAIALLLCLWTSTSSAQQDDKSAKKDPVTMNEETEDPDDYQNPLAGEALDTELFGRTIRRSKRQRSNVTALTLGFSSFAPSIGGNTILPFAALFYRKHWKENRFRAVLSGFYNTIDASHALGPLELLGHFENFTVPFTTTEIIDGKSINDSKLRWGRIETWLGLGKSWPTGSREFDNRISIEAYYRLSWSYYERVHETPDASIIPRDTLAQGVHLRFRLDNIRRNILELPNKGLALGLDFAWLHRHRWRDFGNPNRIIFEAHKTRDIAKLSSFLVYAARVPALSDKHHWLLQIHVGLELSRQLDRFSAFRIGGGSLPTEASDLSRSPLPGAVFDQFATRDYLLACLEYRFEIFFFLYLQMRAHYGLLRSPSIDQDQSLSFKRRQAFLCSSAITSGFVWNSILTLEVIQDINGVVRGGTGGTSIMFMWSKAF